MLTEKLNGTAAAHHLFQLSPQAVYVFDIHNLCCTFLNQGLSSRIGLSSEEAQQQNGQLFYNTVHPADQPRVLQHFEAFEKATDDEIREISYRVKGADGAWHIQLAREAVYSRDEEGLVRQIIGIATTQDSATQTAANDHSLSPLHISSYLAEELAKSLDRISIYNNLIADKEHTSEAVLEYSRGLQTAVAAASQTLQQAAQFSKLSQEDLHLQPTNLSWVAESIRQKHAAKLGEISGVVDFDILPELPAVPEQMMFVFDELLANAIRFRHEERRLLVNIESHIHKIDEAGEVCTILFTDNGSGFDTGMEELVFQPFTKFHPQVQHTGAGIGLAFCRKIIERHGGTLTATTIPDAGSSFFITLPWHAA